MSSDPQGPERPESGGNAAGVGAYLARQRRLRGISVDELCEITKIPRRNLERLESGALDDTPDGFARGFVRTVAAALGLDPDEAVMRLMREPEEEAEPGAPRAQRALLRFAAVALFVGAALLVWRLASDRPAPEPAPPEAPQLQYRRDAVGDLARERVFRAPAERAPEPAPDP